MKKALLKFIKNESGAAIVEYGLALLVVAAVGVGGFSILSTTTGNNVAAACTTVQGASGTNAATGTC